MDSSFVINTLKRMPNNESDDYTIKLKEFVVSNDMINHQDLLFNILESNQPLKIQFTAFYALKIIYRVFGNHSKLIELVDNYGDKFRSLKLYDIVLSIYYRDKGILGEKESFDSAIRHAESACLSLSTNLAIKHHYAELTALMIEENVNVNSEIIDKAILRLSDVIDIHKKVAKYYCTKGRLIAAKGDYALAMKNIKKALDLEVVTDKDSMVRIGQYNYYLLSVKMMENNKFFDTRVENFDDTFTNSDQKMKDIVENIDEMKSRYLEYLGFFSSVLAFIMVTINVAINTDDFNKAVGLVLVIAGALILAFVMFRLLLPYALKDKYMILKTIICIVISMVLIFAGYFCGNGILASMFNKF